MLRKILILILFISILPSCNIGDKTDEGKTELVISAASSLTYALDELKKEFEAQNPNITLTLNFASSGKLAYQIEQGAPVDVFLSASAQFMDQIENKDLIAKDSRISFSSNEMVLITNTESLSNINSFVQLKNENIDMIAIGNPDSVPAGEYAIEILKNLNLWDDLKNKIVYAKDVRQVLAYVESGNVDYGIVYYSDALTSEDIKILSTASNKLHTKIDYPAAILNDSKNKEEAQLFLEYLASDEGKAIIKKYGFK